MDEIEIPEAIRENIELPQKSRQSLSLLPILGALFLFGVVGLLSTFFLSTKPETVAPTAEQTPSKSSPTPQPKSANQPKTNTDNVNTSMGDAGKTLASPSINREISQPQAPKQNLLGHLPYEVAQIDSLEAITADNRLKLRPAAARKFKQMQADARAEGIILTPISAFRTVETQEYLFFDVKEQRVQDAAKRAEVSAPPGYSEHHTGYAIDIGDGNAPATNLETSFAETAAFQWLEKNALKYSFELSFPANNDLGVSYEPWHWRFVGDRHSLETFYKDRN